MQYRIGKYQGRIKAAYEASAFTEGVRPESEEDVKKFKQITPPYHQSTDGYYLPRRLLYGRAMDFWFEGANGKLCHL